MSFQPVQCQNQLRSLASVSSSSNLDAVGDPRSGVIMHALLDIGDVPDGVGFVPRLLDVHLDCLTRCVTVGGELDCASIGLLATVMDELIDIGPGDSSVDISNVTFIGASGLGCLVHFRNQLALLGAKFRVTGATPRQRQLFEIVGLSPLLEAW